LGYYAGTTSQGSYATAVGYAAGQTSQGGNAIAVGREAGQTSQGSYAVAVGYFAGRTAQGENAVAVGREAGQTSQGFEAVAVGYLAGDTSQGSYATAVGGVAGKTSQGQLAVAVGRDAGRDYQGSYATAMGYAAGLTSQGNYAVAVGNSAGQTSQGNYAVAVGFAAGLTSQGISAVAVGNQAGETSQGASAVAVGYLAGETSQGAQGTALGYLAGRYNQGISTTAVGPVAGASNQGSSAVAVGYVAGETSQGDNAVAVGYEAGRYNQSTNAVAMGYVAGQTSQGLYALAMGLSAARYNQGTSAVAVGNTAGQTSQGDHATAVGYVAGQSNQGSAAVAVGQNAGKTSQSSYTVAVGAQAGETAQGENATAVGRLAGYNNQGIYATAVGRVAGYFNQGSYATALGVDAGYNAQGKYSVAVGNAAGNQSQGSYATAVGRDAGLTSQGANAIAVGYRAGETNQHNNSIVLNASGAALNTGGASRTYINPVRDAGTDNGRLMTYNTTTSEVAYMGNFYTSSSRLGINDYPRCTLDVVDMGGNTATGGVGHRSTVAVWDHIYMTGDGSYGYFLAGGVAAVHLGVANENTNADYYGQQAYNGILINDGATSVSAWSDVRIKTKIEALSDVIESIAKLDAIKYNLKQDYALNKRLIGLISQNVRKYFPDLVVESKNGDLSVDYGELPVILLRAIQELQMDINRNNRVILEDTKENPIGLLVSKNGDKYINTYNKIVSIPKVSLSNIYQDKRCIGVISSIETPEDKDHHYEEFDIISEKDTNDNFIFVNSTGKSKIWVTDMNGHFEIGDYITTSNISGYGTKQNDDILHSYTIAKISVNCDFLESVSNVEQPIKVTREVDHWIKENWVKSTEDEHCRLDECDCRVTNETYYTDGTSNVSVSEYSNLEANVQSTYTEQTRKLYERKRFKESTVDPQKPGYVKTKITRTFNAIDENGKLLWEISDQKRQSYPIRYLDAEGNVTDEANVVYRAALVDCNFMSA